MHILKQALDLAAPTSRSGARITTRPTSHTRKRLRWLGCTTSKFEDWHFLLLPCYWHLCFRLDTNVRDVKGNSEFLWEECGQPEQACYTGVSFRFFAVLLVRDTGGCEKTGLLLRPFPLSRCHTFKAHGGALSAHH